jgi:hypothetical protein
LAGIGDAQDAAARLATDHDAVAVDEGHGADGGGHRRVDVARARSAPRIDRAGSQE